MVLDQLSEDGAGPIDIKKERGQFHEKALNKSSNPGHVT
jgi:hypothetical protein